jgi:DUF1365 family protein
VVAAALYDVEVAHARRERIDYAFKHRVFLWLVDLDTLPTLPWWLRPFARFEARDHLGVPSRSIRQNLDAYLAFHGVDLAGGRVLMLANARSLGHVFNPLTVYWCHDRAGALAAVVAEVHNTYGERHCYLLSTDAEGRAETGKAFYVSPFFGGGGRYHMRLPEPGDRLALTVALDRDGARVFTATLRGARRPATGWHPFVALAVSARIRLQGIRLYRRGLPVLPRTPHRLQEDVR